MNEVKRRLAKSGYSCKSLDCNYMDYLEQQSKRTKGFKTPEEIRRIKREKSIKDSLIKENKKVKNKKSIQEISRIVKSMSYIKRKPKRVSRLFEYAY